MAKQAMERREARLVTEPVEIELRQGARTWRGDTTGLNARGLGARLRLVGGSGMPSAPAPASAATVTILGPGLALEEVEGEVLRQEPSWVPGHDAFVAVGFSRLDPKVAGRIDRFVAGRPAARSSERPIREWFVHRRGSTVGPMTSGEVRVAISRGDLDPGDLAWDLMTSSWAPLSSFRSFHAFAAPLTAPPLEALPSRVRSQDAERPHAKKNTTAWRWLGPCLALLLGAGLLWLLLSRLPVSASQFDSVIREKIVPQLPSSVRWLLPASFSDVYAAEGPATFAAVDGARGVGDAPSHAQGVADGSGVSATGSEGGSLPEDVPVGPPVALPFAVFDPGATPEAETWKELFGRVPGGASVQFGRTMTVRGTNDADMWGRVWRRITLDMDREPVLEMTVERVSREGYVLLSGNRSLPGGFVRLRPTITGPGRVRINLAEQTGLKGVQAFQLEVGVTHEGARTNRDAVLELSQLTITASR